MSYVLLYNERMEKAEAKVLVNFRVDKSQKWMIDDLMARWKLNQTATIVRAIELAHSAPEKVYVAVAPTAWSEPPEVEPKPPPVYEKPLPKSSAQRQREDLEARAAAKGVCPDCGYASQYCACGATSA